MTAKCGAESTTRLTCVGSARLGPFTCPTEYGWSGGRAIVIGTEPSDAMDIDKRRVVRNKYRRNVVYV